MSAPGERFPLLQDVLNGDTADVYFLRSRHILERTKCNPRVGMEIFAGRDCVSCGTRQVAQILQDGGFTGELYAVPEGTFVPARQTVAQIYGPYLSFGVYETAILGVLASCSAWATAARDVVDAAGITPVVSFGARHLHPNVAGIMDYAAVVGGCVTCSTPQGATLAGTVPSGTMPHAYVLIMGDTVVAAQAFDEVMPDDVPRIVLVDTFQDEVVESVRVAEVLRAHLEGVRLDTPRERGGVTPELVREVRARLDLAGFPDVKITVSGGLSPDRIRMFQERGAPVDSYGVGSYISGAVPIDHTADIREIDGRPVSKRGRLPGMRRGESLDRFL